MEGVPELHLSLNKDAMNRRPIISSPCSEDWNQMSPTQQGCYCDKCELEVVDFTEHKADAIVAYLDNANGRVCGRIAVKPINYLAYAGALSSLLFSGFTNQAFGQGDMKVKGKMVVQDDSLSSDNTVNENGDSVSMNETRKHIGIVVDQSDEPVPFAKIWVNGIPTALTDVVGRFELELTPSDYAKQLTIQIVSRVESQDTINVTYYHGQVPSESTYVFQKTEEIPMMLGVIVSRPVRRSPFGTFGNENKFDMDEERPSGRSNKRR